MTDGERRRYTSNLLKGSALIPECERLLLEWRAGDDGRSFVTRVVTANVLGKATRSRLRDILEKVFARRFLSPAVPPIVAAKALIARWQGTAVAVKALLYHAALADDLLYDFTVHELFALHEDGRSRVDVSDALAFVNRLTDDGLIAPAWSAASRLRAAQGLLATARDFEVLEGKVTKRFAPAFLPTEVFLYVAYHLRDRGVPPARLREHPDWRLFLVSPAEVERHFLEADQLGFLRYHAAGGIVRIDWAYSSLERAVDGLLTRTLVGA